MALDSSDLLVVQKNADGALYSLKVSDLPQPDAVEYATTTSAGIVRFATPDETALGVSVTTAVTPADLESVKLTEIDGGTYA